MVGSAWTSPGRPHTAIGSPPRPWPGLMCKDGSLRGQIPLTSSSSSNTMGLDFTLAVFWDITKRFQVLKENIKKTLLPMVNITQWFSISFHFGQKTQELKSESSLWLVLPLRHWKGLRSANLEAKNKTTWCQFIRPTRNHTVPASNKKKRTEVEVCDSFHKDLHTPSPRKVNVTSVSS